MANRVVLSAQHFPWDLLCKMLRLLGQSYLQIKGVITSYLKMGISASITCAVGWLFRM